MLHILSDKKRRAFYETQLHREEEVLFEEEVENGCMFGFTRNYVKVTAKYDPLLVNEIKKVKLKCWWEKVFVFRLLENIITRQ